MVFSISYYPDSVAGAFGKPAEGKGICSYHLPELERMAERITNLPIVIGIYNHKAGISATGFKNQKGFFYIHQKPYHLSLEADSPKELSDLAFELSEELNKAGFPYYSLPFDYSQVVEVKSE